MKKSLIATGIVASSMLYGNVSSANPRGRQSSLTPAYQWTIETESDVYTGTCSSITEVNKEISKLTKNQKVLKKNISPIPMMIDHALEEGNNIYTWNIVTIYGHASGVSTNLEEAKKVVESFGLNETIKSEIIESKPKKK